MPPISPHCASASNIALESEVQARQSGTGWPRYPYLVFYVERSDHIDIWRVLHGQRDIPAWLLNDSNAGTSSDP
jgi:hypothetical protein